MAREGLEGRRPSVESLGEGTVASFVTRIDVSRHSGDDVGERGLPDYGRGCKSEVGVGEGLV